MVDLIEAEPIERVIREITPKTFSHWGYRIGEYKGERVHVATHYDRGQPVAQKIRFKDKRFKVLGKMQPLYGMWLWGKGKKLVITEGELDALSMSQAQGNKWPVVSVPNGAAGAARSLGKASEYLANFEEIILMFDMDEAGQEAAEECAQMLPIGKAKIAKLPLKDPNAMLKEGRIRELMTAMWNAEPYRPDGVISLGSVIDDAMKPPEWGMSYPYPTLTNVTYGQRKKEWYCWGAGVGVGKTDNFMQLVAHTLNSGENVGLIYLEQPPTETAKRLAGKLDGEMYHLPDHEYDSGKMRSTLTSIQDRVFMYDHFGAADWDSIKELIRYMKHGCGVDWIYLDHLTALAAHAVDERRELDGICADISSLCQNLNIGMHVVSHLTTPKGEAHEEGGRVKEMHFTGSRAIARWAHFMFGLERNKQAEDETERNTTTIRVLKDRYTGKGTGKTIPIAYDHESGLLQEVESAMDRAEGLDEEDPF